MMHYRLIGVFFLLFLIEFTIGPWMIPASWQASLQVLPHFLLIGVLFVAIFTNRHNAAAYGVFFGMLQDLIFYSHMIGVHSFTYGLAGYMTGLLPRGPMQSLVSVLARFLIGYLFSECLIYAVYWLFNVKSYPFSWAFLQIILPGLLLNLLLALLLYVPGRRWLENSGKEKAEQD